MLRRNETSKTREINSLIYGTTNFGEIDFIFCVVIHKKENQSDLKLSPNIYIDVLK